MSNNKQTAVEWLVSQLNKQGFAQVVTDEEIKQAKEMEKQQIMDDFNNGVNDECLGKNTTAEQYYNEEYGK